ncbi:hypothetical protein ACFL1E_04330, partial [Candidatus Omnitrophota bacterium]
ALHDGYKVNYAEWKRYIGQNRVLFIKEYLMELEREFNTILTFDLWGLNSFNEYIDQRVKKVGEKTYVAKLIKAFLIQECALPGLGEGCEDKYTYSEDDLPEVFFFPPGLARWDGTKVDSKAWTQLTTLQKEKFVAEYCAGLEHALETTIETAPMNNIPFLDISVHSGQGRLMTDVLEEAMKQDGTIDE